VLTRYLVLSVLRGIAAVLGVLIVVGGFVQFVGQLDDIGVANYGIGSAVSYVLLNIPRAVFQSLPAAALLGALLSLGNLAVHHELIVMRSSGVSKLHLVGMVGVAALVLIVMMSLIGETLAPSLSAYAREMRTRALLEDDVLADSQSTWLKDGDLILNLRRGSEQYGFRSGVYLFELDDDKRLKQVAHADSADIDRADQWILSNYSETNFTNDGVSADRRAFLVRQYDLNPELLGLSVVRSDLLDTPALRRYIAYLEDNDLNADQYLIAYWGRIASVVAVLFMTLLAIPFVFGSLRSSAAGSRLAVGLVIGLGFYALDEVLANSGEVFDLDPIVVAWAPTIALGLVTGFALARLR